jgi:hypothetical protein
MRPTNADHLTKRHGRGGRALRLQPVLGAAAIVTFALTGCSSGSGHQVGDAVVTKLHDSSFTGTVSIRVTDVERVTNAAMRQFGFTPEDVTSYIATAKIKVDSGSFDSASAGVFGNDEWGLVADGTLQGGPKLAESKRSDALQKVCPFHADAIEHALTHGGTATVCSVLLAPKSSSVTAVTYLRARSTNESDDEASTITWKATG